VTQTASVILGSAAVGALTSSVITFVGQILERRARQKELLISKAIDLAQLQVKFLQDASQAMQTGVQIYPYIVYARWYHKELSLLHETNSLSQEIEIKYADFLRSQNHFLGRG
jgi:hypothetical protein